MKERFQVQREDSSPPPYSSPVQEEKAMRETTSVKPYSSRPEQDRECRGRPTATPGAEAACLAGREARYAQYRQEMEENKAAESARQRAQVSNQILLANTPEAPNPGLRGPGAVRNGSRRLEGRKTPGPDIVTQAWEEEIQVPGNINLPLYQRMKRTLIMWRRPAE